MRDLLKEIKLITCNSIFILLLPTWIGLKRSFTAICRLSIIKMKFLFESTQPVLSYSVPSIQYVSYSNLGNCSRINCVPLFSKWLAKNSLKNHCCRRIISVLIFYFTFSFFHLINTNEYDMCLCVLFVMCLYRNVSLFLCTTYRFINFLAGYRYIQLASLTNALFFFLLVYTSHTFRTKVISFSVQWSSTSNEHLSSILPIFICFCVILFNNIVFTISQFRQNLNVEICLFDRRMFYQLLLKTIKPNVH